MTIAVMLLASIGLFLIVLAISDSFAAGWIGGVVSLIITQAIEKAMS